MNIKLLGVSGSLRENSHGLAALNIALEAAAEFGAETALLDLRTANLTMYNPDSENTDEPTRRMIEKVTWADAFILVSPDYHGTMSGAMKNFLDYHWSEFSGKLFGYLCASHEKGLTVMDEMRVAIRQCYGWSLPYGLCINGRTDVDAEGHITNQKLNSRCKMAARDIVIYGSMMYGQFLEDVAKNIPDTFAARYA